MARAGFTNVNLYTVSNPTPPCFEIDVGPDGISFDQSFNRGLVQVEMVVRALFAESEGAQVALDSYLDGAAGTDVKAALETDLSLAGAASTLRVTSGRPRRWKSETTGGLLVGIEWAVTVFATGTS